MVCPSCNSTWDQNKSACTRCGFALGTKLQSPGHPFIPFQNNGTPHEQLIKKREPRISPLASEESGSPSQSASQAYPSRLSLSGLAAETPRPLVVSEPGVQQNSQRSRPLRVKLSTSPSSQRTEAPGTGIFSPKDTGPAHGDASSPKNSSHSSLQGNPSTEALKWNFDVQPLPPPLRTASPGSDFSPRRPPVQQPPRPRGISSTSIQSLSAGTTLFEGRYRLLERQGIQEWLFGAFEAVWLAQDLRRAGTLVRICELRLLDTDSVITRSTLRTATMALHTISRHAHVPALWEVFNEQERSFFVFEHSEGESLLARMRRSGHVLPAQEVIECCLQVTDVLEFLLQLSPPLVHGLIRPEYLMEGHGGARYMLANFSVVLAGGATQFVTGIERSRLSVYTPPEFSRGVIDVRSDIYALLASAYYLVTGNAPIKRNGIIPPARQFNAAIPPQFEAILAKGLYSGKGLRPVTTERYQHPSELRQDLLMMHVVAGGPTPEHTQSPQRVQPSQEAQQPKQTKQAAPAKLHGSAPVHTASHPILQALAPVVDEPVMLLPRPEDLPPLVKRNDSQKALLYLISMLICLVLVVLISRGLM